MVQIRVYKILQENIYQKISTKFDLNYYNEVENTEVKEDYQKD